MSKVKAYLDPVVRELSEGWNSEDPDVANHCLSEITIASDGDDTLAIAFQLWTRDDFEARMWGIHHSLAMWSGG